MTFSRILVSQALLTMASAFSLWAASYEPTNLAPPKPVREFRGAWVATVGNIDWPSRPDLSVAEQEAELLAILDRAAQLKLNAIIFQVRPACDAMYASPIEPWSEYLTGAMGKRRSRFMIRWRSPSRRHTSAGSNCTRGSIPIAPPIRAQVSHRFESHQQNQAASRSGVMENISGSIRAKRKCRTIRWASSWMSSSATMWMAFTSTITSTRTRNPKVAVQLIFPDDASWKRFGAGGRLSRDDWRRENVNTFIRRVYESIRASKPWVKFGISPFGIWQPGNPPQIKGFDAYSELYADSRKWLANGWLDYFTPQLYWAIEPKEQSFPVLLDWWDHQNPKSRHIWPGINTTRVRSQNAPDDSTSRADTRTIPPGGARVGNRMKSSDKSASRTSNRSAQATSTGA
jgi:uncharacterized lipoprotein YddW (UPF0748 family)